MGGTVTYNNVIVGTENVKKDFIPANVSPFATLTEES